MIEQIYTYFTIETLYMWINLGVVPFWLILIFFPQSYLCRFFITSIFPFILLSGVYIFILYKSFIIGYNFDGNFIESQAFAYLAIRSYLKLPISFPSTTRCKKAISGGDILQNF